MAKESKGFETWAKALGLLLTFISARAAIHAIRQQEGLLPTSEHVLLLRSINSKLGRATQEESIEDLEYYDIF